MRQAIFHTVFVQLFNGFPECFDLPTHQLNHGLVVTRNDYQLADFAGGAEQHVPVSQQDALILRHRGLVAGGGRGRTVRGKFGFLGNREPRGARETGCQGQRANQSAGDTAEPRQIAGGIVHGRLVAFQPR
jgi:hypothetical protein